MPFLKGKEKQLDSGLRSPNVSREKWATPLGNFLWQNVDYECLGARIVVRKIWFGPGIYHLGTVNLVKTSPRLSFLICKMERTLINPMVSVRSEEVNCYLGGGRGEILLVSFSPKTLHPRKQREVLCSSDSPTLPCM